MEASSQILLFVAIMAVGMFMAVLFDFYRVVRGVLKLNLLLTSLFDLLYWLVAAFFEIGILLAGNSGEVRFYVFIALLAGACLYYRFFSRCFMHVMIAIIRKFLQVMRYLQLILFHIVKLFTYIIRLFTKPFIFVGRKARQYYRVYRHKQ